MSGSSNQLRIRDSSTVRRIKDRIPSELLEGLRKCLASPRVADMTKKEKLKHVGLTPCCVCAAMPELEVLYPLDGITRIERYCESCINKVYAREPVI